MRSPLLFSFFSHPFQSACSSPSSLQLSACIHSFVLEVLVLSFCIFLYSLGLLSACPLVSASCFLSLSLPITASLRLCTASVNILHAPCYEKSAHKITGSEPTTNTHIFTVFVIFICYAGPLSASPALSHQSNYNYLNLQEYGARIYSS